MERILFVTGKYESRNPKINPHPFRCRRSSSLSSFVEIIDRTNFPVETYNAFSFPKTMATATESNNIISNALGSAAAGIIGRIATHPLDTAKARLQSLSGASYRGSADVLIQTFRSEGIRGLYRGFPTVIAGGTPGTIIYLCGYDIFKDRLSATFSQPKNGQKNDESFVVHFTAGILAETVACIIYVPVDVIKERLQIQNPKDSVQYKGGWDALVKICKTEGPLGIYKGYGATLASFGPFSALVSIYACHICGCFHLITFYMHLFLCGSYLEISRFIHSILYFTKNSNRNFFNEVVKIAMDLVQAKQNCLFHSQYCRVRVQVQWRPL